MAALAALLLLLAGCAHARQGGAAPECVLRDFPLVVALGEHETAPGAVDTLRVREYRGHFGPHELPAGCRPVWSIASGAPATLSPATGVLRVDPRAADGATFPVSVRVAQQTAETTVRVVDRARRPLVGRWTEVARTPCGAGAEEPPGETPLRELIFHGNGSFSVTWTPFESYTDYWGTYTYEPRTGRLRFWVEGGNRLPPQRDLDGRAMLEGEDELHLADLWLGSPSSSSRPACGTTFQRQGRPPPGPRDVQRRDQGGDLHQGAQGAAAAIRSRGPAGECGTEECTRWAYCAHDGTTAGGEEAVIYTPIFEVTADVAPDTMARQYHRHLLVSASHLESSPRTACWTHPTVERALDAQLEQISEAKSNSVQVLWATFAYAVQKDS